MPATAANGSAAMSRRRGTMSMRCVRRASERGRELWKRTRFFGADRSAHRSSLHHRAYCAVGVTGSTGLTPMSSPLSPEKARPVLEQPGRPEDDLPAPYPARRTHHPRHLMLNLLSLDRMIGGRAVSGIRENGDRPAEKGVEWRMKLQTAYDGGRIEHETKVISRNRGSCGRRRPRSSRAAVPASLGKT